MFRLLSAGRCAALALVLLAPVASAQREVASFKAEKGQRMRLAGVAISPDGSRVAALIRGGRKSAGEVQGDHVRVRDLKTKKEVLLFLTGFSGPLSPGSLFSYTPDGKKLVCSTVTGLYVFDLKGRQLKAFEARVSPEVAALSADGKTAVCAAAGEVAAYDLKTGKELFAIKTKAANLLKIALSPDGKLAAVSDNVGGVHLFDLKARKELASLPKDKRDGISLLAFSPDSKRLAVCDDPERYSIYDVKKRQKTHAMNMRDHDVFLAQWGMAFTPDGKKVVGAGSGNKTGVFTWEWEAGKVTGDKSGKRSEYFYMALSADGKTLVAGYQEVKVFTLAEDKKPKPKP